MPNDGEKKNDPVFRIHGNVGRDPEMKEAGDKDVCEFSVAVSLTYGKDAETRWYRCAVWKPELQQLVMSEIGKGAKVAVEGFLRRREYENQKGETRVSWDLSTTRVGLIEWLQPERSSFASEEGPVVDPYDETHGGFIDDLPF